MRIKKQEIDRGRDVAGQVERYEVEVGDIVRDIVMAMKSGELEGIRKNAARLVEIQKDLKSLGRKTERAIGGKGRTYVPSRKGDFGRVMTKVYNMVEHIDGILLALEDKFNPNYNQQSGTTAKATVLRVNSQDSESDSQVICKGFKVPKSVANRFQSVLNRIKDRYGLKAYVRVKEALVRVGKGKSGPKMYRKVSQAFSAKKWKDIKAANRGIRAGRRRAMRDVAIAGVGTSAMTGGVVGRKSGERRGKEMERLRYAAKTLDLSKRARDMADSMELSTTIEKIKKVSTKLDIAIKKEMARKDIKRFAAAGLLDSLSELNAQKLTKSEILSKRRK